MSNPEYVTPERKLEFVERIVAHNPEIIGLQAYEYLRNNSAGQKDSFIAGAQTHLDLAYPDLTRKRIYEIADPTEVTLTVLMPDERTPKTESLYDAVEARYTEMAMLGFAADMNDDSLSEQDRDDAKEWFKKINEALYGAPDKAIFSALAGKHITPKLDAVFERQAKTILQELAELVGPVDTATVELFQPKQELIEKVGRFVVDRFGYLVSHVDDNTVYETEGMVSVIDEALLAIDALKLGWKTGIARNSSMLAVSAHRRLVEVGEDRPRLPGNELKGKVLHEVGVHVLRSVNAERAGWLSAAYGQDGYLDFEEALGTALEDAYAAKFKDRGEDYYLLAGLAYGLDNNEPRDFREVYEIAWRTFALRNLKPDEEQNQKVIGDAKEKAFNSCLRLFRGTTTKDKGLIYLKDLAYFNGQSRAWSVLKDVQSDADFDFLFTGKLDLTRPDHLVIAHDIVEANNTLLS